jgi:hypothetical protein
MRRVIVFLGLLATAAPAWAADGLVKFDGGIGVIPVSRVNPATGLGVPNTVLGVNPGGQPWVIGRLQATVFDDGRITVDGRGLLLAGGNGIGTNGGQSVRAMLFCGAASFTSDLVALDEAGDFRIDGGMLSALPPSQCDNPALLIVNAGGAWFAAGILKR